MPSSLTWFLPGTSVFSTGPPVSVCGTDGRIIQRLDAFLGGMENATSARVSPRLPVTPRAVRPGFAWGAPCTLGPPIPAGGWRDLPRHAVARCDQSGNVDPDSIGYAFRPRLRARLTLGGRTWPRKPWTFGGEDFRLPFRYSCLHGRLQPVHGRSRSRFAPAAALSYQLKIQFRGFGCAFESRSFSARIHSSSELLRTLQMVAASEPTSWMSVQIHILQTTKRTIGGLGRRSGLFPF